MFNFLSLINVFFESKIQINLDSYIFIELFFNDKALDTYLFGFFDKNSLLNCMNIFNFIKYICYSNIKKIMLYIYYYIIQIFLIVVYNNMPNKFVKIYLNYYYIFKNNILQGKKYIMLGYVKKWRFWRNYYRFYHISYLKILFFFLFFILFILMWKRRNTYLKRAYIWNLILFYIFSVLISFLLWPLFLNKFLSICISLLISFLIIFFRLN